MNLIVLNQTINKTNKKINRRRKKDCLGYSVKPLSQFSLSCGSWRMRRTIDLPLSAAFERRLHYSLNCSFHVSYSEQENCNSCFPKYCKTLRLTSNFNSVFLKYCQFTMYVRPFTTALKKKSFSTEQAVTALLQGMCFNFCPDKRK